MTPEEKKAKQREQSRIRRQRFRERQKKKGLKSVRIYMTPEEREMAKKALERYREST